MEFGLESGWLERKSGPRLGLGTRVITLLTPANYDMQRNHLRPLLPGRAQPGKGLLRPDITRFKPNDRLKFSLRVYPLVLL